MTTSQPAPADPDVEQTTLWEAWEQGFRAGVKLGDRDTPPRNPYGRQR